MSTHGPLMLFRCIFVLCGGCASVMRDQALRTAKGELTRHHCILLSNYAVVVGEGVFEPEVGSPRPLWEVEFSAQTRRGKKPLYVVLINRRSGAVHTFSDISRTIPSRF